MTAQSLFGTSRNGAATPAPSPARVLIAGGVNNTGKVLASAEIYNPTTGKFAPTGSMAQRRDFHTATVLPTGKVLIAGGYAGGAINEAELYDPARGSFTKTGNLTSARALHTATLLSDGNVLIAGGENDCTAKGCTTLATAELYDPKTGRFTRTGSMLTARDGHTATLLQNGQVLIAAGCCDFFGNVLSSAELYNPATGKFKATSDLNNARTEHTATLLKNGGVLIVGGTDFYNPGQPTELYVPASRIFVQMNSTYYGRLDQTATLLQDGDVLVAGGIVSSGTEARIGQSPDQANQEGRIAELFVLLAPEYGDWFVLNSLMIDVRSSHSATLLQNGNVLIAGGYDGSKWIASAEVFNVKTGTFAATGSMNTARGRQTASPVH